MKKIFPYLAIALCAAILPACSDDDDENGGPGPNGGSTGEFQPSNLPAEPYADDAIKVVNADGSTPFYSLELMGDGYYLLTYSNSDYGYYSKATVSKANGGFIVHKNRKATNRVATRSGEDGTIYLDNGEYGKFIDLGDKQYRLSNGDVVDLQGVTEDNPTIYYTSGSKTTEVDVTVEPKLSDTVSTGICRAWNYDSFEVWAYVNGSEIYHGKQTRNGDTASIDVYNNPYEYEDYEFFDDAEYLAYKVVFSGWGTYLTLFLDGYAELDYWKWDDMKAGTIYWADEKGYEYDGLIQLQSKGSYLYCTEDYSETEGGMTARLVGVHTLSAAE